MIRNYEEMKQTNIKTVDINELVDIQSILIDETLGKEEKVLSYVEQLRNPYCFKYGDVAIKVSYAEEGATLEEKIESLILAL